MVSDIKGWEFGFVVSEINLFFTFLIAGTNSAVAWRIYIHFENYFWNPKELWLMKIKSHGWRWAWIAATRTKLIFWWNRYLFLGLLHLPSAKFEVAYQEHKLLNLKLIYTRCVVTLSKSHSRFITLLVTPSTLKSYSNSHLPQLIVLSPMDIDRRLWKYFLDTL